MLFSRRLGLLCVDRSESAPAACAFDSVVSRLRSHYLEIGILFRTWRYVVINKAHVAMIGR